MARAIGEGMVKNVTGEPILVGVHRGLIERASNPVAEIRLRVRHAAPRIGLKCGARRLCEPNKKRPHSHRMRTLICVSQNQRIKPDHGRGFDRGNQRE